MPGSSEGPGDWPPEDHDNDLRAARGIGYVLLLCGIIWAASVIGWWLI